MPAGAGVGRIGLAAGAGSVYAAIDFRDPLPEGEWDLGDGAVNPLRLRRMSREELLAQDPAAVAAFLRLWPLLSRQQPGVDAAALIAKVEAGEIRMADLLARLEAADPGIFRREIRGVEVYRSADGGASWKRTHAAPLRRAAGFEGYRFGRLALAPDDPARVYFVGHDLIVSGDAGKTWFGGRPAQAAGTGHHALWIDPAFPRRLWLGGDSGLAASYDGGKSWTRLLPEPPAACRAAGACRRRCRPSRRPPKAATCLTARFPPSRRRRACRISSGRAATTARSGSATTAADAWSEVGDGLPAARRVSALEASRHQDGRAFVALDGRQDDDLTPYLFRGAENGRTWTSLTGNLPAEPILALAEDPLNGEILYVGTERGVYASFDRGGSWQALAAGIPVAPVAALEVRGAGAELVATLGDGGVYRLALAPLRELPRLMADPLATVAFFPLAPVAAQEGWYTRRDPWRHDPAGDPRLAILFYSALDGPAELRLVDAEGRVLRRLGRDVKRGIAAFEWDLLLDERLALQAEQEVALRAEREKAARDKAAAERERKQRKGKKRGKTADDEDSPPVAPPALEKGALARMPWAEALRLGRPLYVTPGRYTLEVQVGEAVARTLLVVAPPAAARP